MNGPQHRTPDPLALLAGGGDMGERTRAFDWSKTPVGPIGDWPQSLKTVVRTMLDSRYAMWLGWGPELTFFYNDAYARMTLGHKHPGALGRSAREVWPEIWDDIGPRAESVMRTGRATWDEGLLLFLERRGFLEETYHTFSYSPVPDDRGGVGGMLCVVTEDTERTIGERRLRTLRELAARTTDVARSVEEACRTAARTLAGNTKDVPFALLYLLDAEGRRAALAGATGVGPNTPISPAAVDLAGPDGPWPFRTVAESGKASLVEGLPARCGALPGGAWPEPAQQALVMPMARPGQTQLAGFVVAGISPRRPFDDDYRGFLDLLAGQVATAVANARAYEEERRRAEALAELDRAKTTFFSNVSHEFRTPLTLILGPVADALDGELPQPQRELLEVARRNGLRLQRLVNSLLDFSRIEAGRVRACYEPTDLAALTADLASNFRSACEKAGLELRIDTPPLPEPVFVDRQMWEKVVLNLLSNAFKFTFAGALAVSVRQAGRAAELRVQDTGTGIPAEELPRLFERFHRVENVKGRTHEGSGIGLALVHELVKLHGGSIAAESEVGRGTTFTVSIPLGSAHLPREQLGGNRSLGLSTTGASPFVEEALRWLPDAEKDEGGRMKDEQNPETDSDSSFILHPSSFEGRPRVLVADDNADMRRYVARLLSVYYTVEAVHDGEAALAAVRRQRPELILTDVMMPRLDGFGLLRAVRADPDTAGVPVIMLSARAGEESRVEGAEAGADDYLVKPFSARELVARVSAQLQLARLRREASESLRQSEERLRNIFEQTTAGIAQVDLTGRFLFVNQRFCEITGYSVEELRATTCGGITHPDDRAGDQSLFETALAERRPYSIEKRYVRKDGSHIWVRNSVSEFTDSLGRLQHMLAVSIDISERKRVEALQDGQQGILEMIARGAPLPDVLAAVCRVIEEQEPGLLCSILLTDDGGRHTGTGFGPSLPGVFVQALEGIPIAPPHAGSCCQALDCGQEVVVPDIATDRRWSAEWRELNLSHGLRACRSIPIRGSDGAVLASVAVFRRQPGDPGPSNKQLLGIATHLAGIAIERRRAEERERALLVQAATANAQFRAFFEQGALFAGIMHTDGTIIEPNRLSLEACGYTREDVVGKVFWECPWWNRSAELMERIRAASAQAAAGEAFRAELPYFVADGSERMVDLIVLPIKDESGRVMFLAPTGTDITDRKRAQQQLAEAHEFLHSSIDALSSHIAVLDENGVILAVNDAWRRFGDENSYTGHNYGVGSNYLEECEPSTGECVEGGAVADGLRDVLTGRKPFFEVEYPCHSPNEERWFVMRVTRFKSPGPVRVVVSHENVTKRKQAEEALKDANRRKDEFLATLAHELRNPLAPIRNGLQIMRLSNGDRVAVEQARLMMERQLGQMVHLVDDLLDLSRISRGKIALRKERVELTRAIQQAVETSRPLIDAAGHDLTIELPSQPIFVDADTTRLAQVISNLLNNAAKYTERGGRIALAVERQGGNAVVRVRDTGMGIPAHMLPRVFDIFTQVDRSLERSQGGLGIGLSLVKGLVEMHGGSVEARSDGHGMGSEFIVRLPLVLSLSTPEPVAEAEEQPPPQPRRRILVVDDNRDAATSLALMLKLMGNETQTAHDGLEGLEVGAAFRPDVMLLDIGMPRLNGYDTAQRVRQQPWGKNVVLVALTGWGQDEDRRRSAEAGFNCHLVKPIDPEALDKLLAGLQVSAS